MKKLSLLLLEDEELDVYLVQKILEKAGIAFDITITSSEKEFLLALNTKTYDAVLADNSLPQFSALKALQIIKDRNIHVPFIFVTGTVSEEYAVNVMKQGAWDYILKDRLQRLPTAILNAIEKHRLEAEYQEKLKDVIQSEALMKEAERLAHFGSWEIDTASGTHHWSDEIYNILGYEVGGIVPSFDNLVCRIHPEDQNYVQQIIDTAFADLTHQKYYCRIGNYNEPSLKHVEGEIFITKDENGKVTRINGFTRDISERKKAELQSIESEKKYKQLFENNPTPSWVLDGSDFRFLDVNNAAIAHYGYTYEEFLSMSAIDIRPKEDRARFVNLDRTDSQNGRKGLWKHKKKDGTIIDVEISMVQLLFDGKPSRLIIANDITEKKEAEQALMQSQANLYTILNLIPLAIFAKDYDGNFLFINNNFAELHGYSAETMIGESIMNTIPVLGEAGHLLSQDQEVILSGQMKVIPEFQFTKHTGEVRTFHSTKLPYLPAGKKQKAVLGIANDITDQKNAELQKAKMIEDIIQRNKDLEQFSYIISHNLRAPVANLMGISDLLEHNNLLPDEVSFLMQSLSDCVKNLDKIIIDLNHITQVKHTINERKEQVYFHKIVDSIISSMSSLGNPADIIINTDFDEVDSIYTVNNYIHSIFYNLLTNSMKYKQPDLPLVCGIKSRLMENSVELTFKDNGMGIDLKKTGDQLFELYKRFHIGAAEGKGMGLFMVKTHVEAMGGKINVTSEVNKGIEFIIELPLYELAN